MSFMPRKTLVLAILLAALASCVSVEDAPPDDSSEFGIAALGFLAGNWGGEAWGGDFEAYYSTSEGGRVIGHSRLLVEGRESFHEFEVFEPHEKGVLLRPFPGGRAADTLRLVAVDGELRRAVFENPRKDYPTRIVYEIVENDRLRIKLDDPHGGSKKSETFDLKRVAGGSQASGRGR